MIGAARGRAIQEHARRAGLGRVTRVHRQHRAAAAASTVVVVCTVSAGCAGLGMFLTGTTFWQIPVFADAVLWVLLRIWVHFGPVWTPGGRHWYAVAERGVLVWSPQKKPVALQWSNIQVATSSSWQTTGEGGQTNLITVPTVCAHRSLVRAAQRGGPVPLTGKRRLARMTAIGIVGAVMAWFIVVPLAADVVLGVQPTKITDFVRICTGGGGYGRAAAYQGTGPHSTVIYETIEGTTDGYTDYPDYSETGSKNFNDYPRPQAVQLVACSRVIGHASQTPLYQCQYQGGYTEVTFQGRWQVDVYTAQTGRKVASYVVDGSTAESDSTSPCMNFAYARADAPNELDLDTSPEGRGYEAAFAPLVNAVAHH